MSMADKKFKTGDVVRLRSGGPNMTVVSYGKYLDGEKWACKWFDDKRHVIEDTFFEEELELVPQ
jgi:uncharacterized protein YodC (DUF2158 family)